MKNSTTVDLTLNSRRRVTQHFDSNVALYVDQYASAYSRMCDARLLQLSRHIPRRPINVLDVGCGAGVFMDKLLASLPGSAAIGIDRSSEMLRRNTQDCRKHLLCGDATTLPFKTASFDVINVDAIMHHLVHEAGYRESRATIGGFLRSLLTLIRPNGVLAIREIFHESIVIPGVVPLFVFWLSSAHLPDLLGHVLRRFGLMTAGAGVAFLTRSEWIKVLDENGWVLVDQIEDQWPRGWKVPGLRSGDLYYICRAAA